MIKTKIVIGLEKLRDSAHFSTNNNNHKKTTTTKRGKQQQPKYAKLQLTMKFN